MGCSGERTNHRSSSANCGTVNRRDDRNRNVPHSQETLVELPHDVPVCEHVCARRRRRRTQSMYQCTQCVNVCQRQPVHSVRCVQRTNDTRGRSSCVCLASCACMVVQVNWAALTADERTCCVMECLHGAALENSSRRRPRTPCRRQSAPPR